MPKHRTLISTCLTSSSFLSPFFFITILYHNHRSKADTPFSPLIAHTHACNEKVEEFETIKNNVVGKIGGQQSRRSRWPEQSHPHCSQLRRHRRSPCKQRRRRRCQNHTGPHCMSVFLFFLSIIPLESNVVILCVNVWQMTWDCYYYLRLWQMTQCVLETAEWVISISINRRECL